MKSYLDTSKEILIEFNMKNIFFSLIIIATIGACNSANKSQNIENIDADTCDCNALFLNRETNRFYISDQNKPYTGTCEIIKNNVLIETRELKNGVYDGLIIKFYPNGNKQTEIQYKNGFMDGDFKHFSDKGDLNGHSIYKRNKLIKTIIELKPLTN
jgi:antitoxin component YwqK of YwqJK toxin-antitoxin module